MTSPRSVAVALALLLASTAAAPARADQVRFRFVPDVAGNMAQVPAGPNGALGEHYTGLGLIPQPYARTLRPNVIVTFRNPYNGRNATVPLALPAGSPRLEYRQDRVIYHYTFGYSVEARFFPDGSVDTVYIGGLLRPVSVDGQ